MDKSNEHQEIISRLRKESGLSRKDVFEKYKIPAPTLANWEYGKGSCPEYVFDYLCDILNREIEARKPKIWVLLRIEENHEDKNGAVVSGIGCYVGGSTLSWFYPFSDGKVSTDAILQIALLMKAGYEIKFEGRTAI